MSTAVKWPVQSQQNVWAKFIKIEMPYSESEPDFSNFAINSLSSKSKSKSESESESDFISIFYEFRYLCFLYSIFTLF